MQIQLIRVVVFFCFSQIGFAQSADSVKVINHFSGAISVTNNGISIIPSFSLGKPAAIGMFSLTRKRFSFDPDFRFSLEGKPWLFLFWGRYKIVPDGKFKLSTGLQFGLNHKTSVLSILEDTIEATVVRRYVAGEFFPRYSLTKHINIGIYCLYSHGIDAGTIKNTSFVTLNMNFSNLKLSDKWMIHVNPQCYYLKLDEHDGFYFTSSVTFSRKNFPVSISGIINKSITSNIPGKDFVWNISLVYSFNKHYVHQ
ncbi:MAG: hypothetical protein JNN28_10005 [Saprospiraceae bacterium]|nr:hypothetical protein [Saprospiraceae bacterium]